MSFFDFSDAVELAVREAKDDASRLSARTVVGRRLFPSEVKRAGFSLMSAEEELPTVVNEPLLVIGIATWSGPDLAALDRLAQKYLWPVRQVFVLDIDDWSLDDMPQTLPGARGLKSTPFVLQYRDGALTYSGEGHDAILWLDQI